MKITRTVHPIGQGGFYTEEFYDEKGDCIYRVVYDCGGNNIPFMESYLKNYIKNSKVPKNNGKIEINAIFISHLHSDHINGLQYLLKHANVRKLFLPQMNDCMKFEIWLNYKLYFEKNNPGLLNLLTTITDDEQDLINERTRIIRVKFANENSRINFDNTIDINEIPDDTKTINSGEILSLKKANENIKWLYIPYNPKYNTDFCSMGKFSVYFKNNLKKELNDNYKITINDDDLLPNNLPKTIDNILNAKIPGKTINPINIIKNIYKIYFNGNHNAYSMTLFSGLEDPVCYNHFDFHYLSSYICCPDLYYCFCHCKKAQKYTPNCLYTGDYDAKSYLKQLEDFYDKLWETIKTVQVPHHGSRHNHNDDLYEYPIKGFISAGVKNNHRHPHTDTLTKIGKNKCIPIIVTEDKDTKYEEFISI